MVELPHVIYVALLSAPIRKKRIYLAKNGRFLCLCFLTSLRKQFPRGLTGMEKAQDFKDLREKVRMVIQTVLSMYDKRVRF